MLSRNATAVDLDELYKCGINYCPTPDNLTKPPISSDEAITEDVAQSASEEDTVDKTNLYILAGVYLAFSLASALVVALFVDPLTRYEIPPNTRRRKSLWMLPILRYGEDERDEGKEKLSGLQLLMATFKHMRKYYQILIIPLTFWSGVEQGFFGADFTAVGAEIPFVVRFVRRYTLFRDTFPVVTESTTWVTS